MNASDYLPTIQQILAQADRITEPMSDEESREWFRLTVEENQERLALAHARKER